MAMSGTGPDDDAALVRRLVAGERAAIETVYRRHNGAMIRVATGITGNLATAEEVAQDSWLSVLTKIGGFEGRSSLAGWIFTILVNKARSRARRDGRMVSFDAGGEEDGLAAAFDGRGHWKSLPDLWDEVTPERILSGRRAIDLVTEAIDALPAGQRAVIEMRGRLGMEATEVAAVLGITEGNMRVLLHRARLTVRKALGDAMERPAGNPRPAL